MADGTGVVTMKRMYQAITILCLIFLLSGCGIQKLEPVYEPEKESTPLVPIVTKEKESYVGEEATIEETIQIEESEDGFVRIEKKSSYYEVWIQLDKGSHYDCGKAYAEAILAIKPDFVSLMEPYLYENINSVFAFLEGDYSVLQERLDDILPQISKEYREEMEGFAKGIATASQAFCMDGAFSEQEVMLLNLIPDLIRPTQCSAGAVYGNRSATGGTIAARILEWGLGNENQMAQTQAVVHFEQGEHKFTSYSVLGLFNALSVYNDNGVFLAILDSNNEEAFVSEGKSSYTFAVRTAVEQYETAKEAADYLASVGENMTFAHNVFASDDSSAYAAEICPSKEVGICAVRSADSKLMNGLSWGISDAICVVNGFALEGNYDNMTGSHHNMIRWSLFEEGLGSMDKISMGAMKDLLTQNDPNNDHISKLYSNYTFQMILIDSVHHQVEIAFASTGKVFPQHPEFIKVQ